MNKYLASLNDEIQAYFKILCPEFPEWLLEYIDTPEMQRIKHIGISCGIDYSSMFDIRYWYSNLEHSVGVALILWHFTQDKKQTLAGLFHDIATPVFKHCIDFMNGDSEQQESTEERTEGTISNSEEIMRLLKRDGIELEEIIDYKIYPLADNETPNFSADRFEYSFASGLTFFRIWELDTISECYNNVTILKNEQGMAEFGFKDINICEKYINTLAKIWPMWICGNDKMAMQFMADMVRAMWQQGYLEIDDLYTCSEQEIINRIINCPNQYLSEAFNKYRATKTAYDSSEMIEDVYCVSIKSKRRYIIPLVHTNNGIKRIDAVSAQAKKAIDEYLNQEYAQYNYFNFDFKPQQNKVHKLSKTKNK